MRLLALALAAAAVAAAAAVVVARGEPSSTDGRGDPEPSYGLELFVESTSAARYARAFLTVRVPRSLGRPLTREDIRRSLWQSGTIRIGTRCGLRGRYVALSVKAFPPA